MASTKKKPKIPAPPTGLGAAALSPLTANSTSIKGLSRDQIPLGPPPPGTYDPVLDYNAGAAQRGFTQTQNDAQTLFDQGQEDYGLSLGDLTRNTEWTRNDLYTSGQRLNEDYGLATAENQRQYGILGRQQAEGAAQRGVTSAGLLGKSAAVRAENQGRDQAKLDLSKNRGQQDLDTQWQRSGALFDRGKLGLDLGNARQFGGFNGALINNPLTGTPYTGSLATGVQRAFTENEAYQGGIAGQRIDQARAGGYISPLLNPPGLSNPIIDDPYRRDARRVSSILQDRR